MSAARLLGVAQVRAIEAAAQATRPDPPLMERAGGVVAAAALDMLGHPAGSGASTLFALAAAGAASSASGLAPHVFVLAGPGNNGGDSLVAARHLQAAGMRVSAILVGDLSRLPPDAAHALDAWLAAGGALAGEWPPGVPDLIIDGLLGIGISRAPDGPIADLIRLANASGAPILAIDVPSGLDADTGFAHEPAIRAQRTVTFLGDKVGLHRADGPACAGVVMCDWLGCEAFAAGS